MEIIVQKKRPCIALKSIRKERYSEPDKRQRFVGPHGIGRYFCDQRDVLISGQARYEIIELEDDADVLTSVEGETALPEGRQLGVSEEELPARRSIEAAHDVQQRRLAAP